MTDSFLWSATSSANTCNKKKFQVVYCMRSTQNYQDILYFQNVNTVSWDMFKCNFIYTHTKCISLPVPIFTKLTNAQSIMCRPLNTIEFHPKWT
jgi:hypothetical protein